MRKLLLVPLMFAMLGVADSDLVHNDASQLVDRNSMNFEGELVTCADDTPNLWTECTIGPTSVANHDMILFDGTSSFITVGWPSADCSDAATDKILYAPGTHVITCGVANVWDVTGTATTTRNNDDLASVRVALLQGADRTSAMDNDEAYLSLQHEDSAGALVEFGRFIWTALDITAATKDEAVQFEVMIDNTLRPVAHFGVDTIIGHANVDTINLTTNSTGNAELVVPAQSISGAEILNDTITATQLAAIVTFSDGDLLDFGTFISSATEGILLPKHATSCASATGEGQICWDADDDSSNALWIGDGTVARNIAAGAGDIDTVGDCVIGACFTGASGTKLDSNTDLIFEIDADNNGSETFQVLEGAGGLIFEITETGVFTFGDSVADEDITIDLATTANSVDISTNSGVVQWDFGSLTVKVGRLEIESSGPRFVFDDNDSGVVDAEIEVDCPTTDDCDFRIKLDSGSDTEVVVFEFDTPDDGLTTLDIGQNNIASVTIDTDGSGDGELVLPLLSVSGAEMVTDTVTATQLSDTLTMADGDFLNFAASDSSDATDGLVLPQIGSACAASTAEGQICWDTVGDDLYVGDGAAGVVLINTAAGAHADTITWTGTSVLESGVAFAFGDGTDATITHTYNISTANDPTFAYTDDSVTMTNAATFSVEDLTCTDCIGPTDVDLTANFAWTGDHDFSGGGIEIENGTTPPACTEGQLFFDTDATSGSRLMGCESTTFVTQGGGGGSDTNAVREICFDAASLQPLDSNYGVLEQEAGGNMDIFYRSFDTGTRECVSGKLRVPGDYDGTSAITFRFYWETNTTTGGVTWQIEELDISDGESWDQAEATPAGIDCTNPGTVELIDDCNGTLTQATLGWTAGDLVLFKVCRDVADANDTMADDAHLLMACMEFPRS